jgi:ABC-type transporter Mla subunit MlaD
MKAAADALREQLAAALKRVEQLTADLRQRDDEIDRLKQQVERVRRVARADLAAALKRIDGAQELAHAERERADNAERRNMETRRDYDELSERYEAAVRRANDQRSAK